MPGRILVDTTPLRESRDFRLLFTGQLISMLGTQLTVVAIPYQVYSMTHSSLQVGAISLAQLIPFLAGALSAGPIGDAVDRRRIMVWTAVGMTLTSARHGRQRRRAPPVARRALRRQLPGRRPHGVLQHGPHGVGPRPGRAPAPHGRLRHDADHHPGGDGRRSRALGHPARHRAAARLLARCASRSWWPASPRPHAPAHPAGRGRRGPLALAVDQGGAALPALAPGAPGRLPDRHQRHGVRHAPGALPRHGGRGLRGRHRHARLPLRRAGRGRARSAR